jgi:hypothetical protein
MAITKFLYLNLQIICFLEDKHSAHFKENPIV